jgi:hypothetical protein
LKNPIQSTFHILSEHHPRNSSLLSNAFFLESKGFDSERKREEKYVCVYYEIKEEKIKFQEVKRKRPEV